MEVVNIIESKIKGFISKLTDYQKFAFYSAVILGIIAHGFALFNRLSVHDNSHCLFALGATYEVNRWGLGIIYKLQVLSTKTFSLPLFNGLLSIMFIACAAMVLVKTFDIKSKLVSSIIGGLMVVFPMVTSTFSFMFTTWPYFMGLLFAFLAAYTLIREVSAKNVIISVIWLTLSLGLYQAFLGVVVTLFLTKMMFDVIDGKTESIVDYAKAGVIYLIDLGLGLGLWAIIGKAFRTVKHIELETYKGWDEGYNLAKLPARLAEAIKNFLTFRMEGINALRYLRMLAMLIFLLAVVMIIMLVIKSSAKASVKIASVVGIILIPIAMMVVYLLSTSSQYKVSTLMVYPEIFVYLIPLLMLGRFEGFKAGIMQLLSKCVSALLILCTVVVTIGYVYLDNAAYFKAAIYQEQAVAYMTALLANIKSTPGFSDDLEIVFVGFENVEDATINEVAAKEEMDGVQLEKYYNTLVEMLNEGVNIQFLRDHLGIGNENMRIEDPNHDTEVSDMPEVKAMPVYPNDGSIQIIDDMLVVKMGENIVEDDD
ncbi:MAG: glucosyltransferase domain-containing protein [Pseudobutyrivibrio sp.]|nr:glucosyltransferase domain-containing protein [Pseudobutyrivibrio sp.]